MLQVIRKIYIFVRMTSQYVNIHTHRPTGRGIELRTAGVHPWHADTEEVETLTPLAPEVQAVGETGLDFLRGPDHARQAEVFRAQLALAEEHDLPVVLHSVKAFEPVMDCLARYCLRAVIFHGFIGSPEQAARAVERGYYLSFGQRSFASHKTVEAFCRTPLDRIFFETDDGDTPIEKVYAHAAVVRGLCVDELREATLRNYERIFGTVPPNGNDTNEETESTT